MQKPMKTSTLLNSSRFATSRTYFVKAYRFSRAWSRVVSRATKRFGERSNGGHVSGIYSEHLPEHWKNGLRVLAKNITVNLDLAYNSFPKRTRFRTKMDLKRAIIDRDGKGFYG